MAVEHLDPVRPVREHDGPAVEHAMRTVTRQVAFESGWSEERAGKVAALFDSMASAWTADHAVDERYWPLEDALERGRPTRGRVIELGSGTGLGTELIGPWAGSVLAIDLSWEMLIHAPEALGPRVQADSNQLPLPDASVDCCVLVNMLLFPAEVDRILRQDGTVVWVNTVGERTPIHLSAEEVIEALPGPWTAVASRAGLGTWAVCRRR